MRYLCSILIFLMLTTFLGCTKEENKRDGFADYEELIIGTGNDSTRPGNYQTFGMWEPSCLIYETLVNLDQDSKPIPCLAKSWSISDDSKRYTFKLEKGVHFHDGTSFNAHAVKTNYEKLGTLSWQMLNRVIREVSVKDDHTIEFKLSRPSRLFLIHLAISTHGIVAPSAIKPESARPSMKDGMKGMPTALMPAAMKQKIAQMKKDKSQGMPQNMKMRKNDMRSISGRRSVSKSRYIVEKAFGTGPYRWDEASYQRAKSFSVVRNDRYWRETPLYKKITWLVISDPTSRAIALEAGEIHLTGQSPNASLTEENLIALRRNNNIKLTKASNWGARMVIINHKRPPFDQPEVRRALKHAIDYNAIQIVIGDLATICPGPFGPRSPYTLPNNKLPAYDPEKANAILDKAGLKDNDNDGVREYKGKPIKLGIVTSKSQPTGVLLSENLAKIGIKATLKPKESGSIFSVLQEMDYDIITHPNIPSFYLDLYGSFHSKSWLSLHLDDPKLDDLLERYIACEDEDQFQELNYQIQKEVLKLDIILFSINESKMAAYHKSLGEFIYPPEEWVGAVQNIWKQKLAL